MAEWETVQVPYKTRGDLYDCVLWLEGGERQEGKIESREKPPRNLRYALIMERIDCWPAVISWHRSPQGAEKALARVFSGPLGHIHYLLTLVLGLQCYYVAQVDLIEVRRPEELIV